MASNTEVFNVNEIWDDLSVTVPQAPENSKQTILSVEPPIDEYVQTEILQNPNISEKLRGLIERGSVLGTGRFFKLDESPSPDHLDLGAELAQEVVDIRGLRAGIVLAAYHGERKPTRFVTNISETAVRRRMADRVAAGDPEGLVQVMNEFAPAGAKEAAQRLRQQSTEG